VWDYGTIYGWQSINLSQSGLPTGFAGANTLIHSILEWPLENPPESLLESLLESLIGSLIGSLLESLFRSRACESRALAGVVFPQESLGRLKTLSFGRLWPIEGFHSVEALT